MDEKLLKFISGNVDMDQVNLAIKRMEHNRAPLYHIDSGLYDQITELFEEYGEDNGLPEGWYLIDDIDPEDIIFKIE